MYGCFGCDVSYGETGLKPVSPLGVQRCDSSCKTKSTV
ncbi:MAG: hypothetical protein JETT_0076 [Candidatus Jettenia ecosi]|uniref:Uncharacterized protein n=1 Tax=Candidatus Jettenia ecosi TaxID=2494326 RepID=A0A533QFS8_9BACT|nr:MAG: hypothetical protein JETT_0076 [Candidatus Jettenia ecosi]